MLSEGEEDGASNDKLNESRKIESVKVREAVFKQRPIIIPVEDQAGNYKGYSCDLEEAIEQDAGISGSIASVCPGHIGTGRKCDSS